MYISDGTETLVRIRAFTTRDHMAAGEHQIAMDAETLAHYHNDPDVEVIEEVMTFSRLDPERYQYLQPREGMS